MAVFLVLPRVCSCAFLVFFFLTGHNSISICEIFQVLRFPELVIVTDKKGLYSLYFSCPAIPRLLFLLLRCWWMNVVKLLGETCLHTLMKVVKRNVKSLPKCQKLLKTYAQVIARSTGDASIALVFATTDLQQMTARYRSIKYQIFQCKLLIYLN